MTRYYIIKDGSLTGVIAPTKEAAIDEIRHYQSKETSWICSEYGYIKGEEVIVPYPDSDGQTEIYRTTGKK